ncbi:hypothetical protein CMV_027509 [Castanea mollissima]|uniref:Uncharacterized protein n=1 Tax=Castanea mollissima TaxID=60419 RepID=A0A8J4V9A8_9ROSI|nr:hypothetical protein CMV_027509 [Castanea mollissima]
MEERRVLLDMNHHESKRSGRIKLRYSGSTNLNKDSHETTCPQNLNLKLTHFSTTLSHVDSIPVEDEVDTAKNSEAMIIVAPKEAENWVSVPVDHASEKFMHLRSINSGQDEQISTPDFEGSDIGFKVGYGNVQGNKNKSKVRPKRSGNHEKGVSQSLYGPKKVEAEEESKNGSPKTKKNWKRLARAQIISNSSTADMDSKHKRKQVGNCNKDAIGVKREKKHKIMENEQGVVSTTGLMEAAGQPCQE